MNKSIIRIYQYEPFLIVPGSTRSFKYYPTKKEILQHKIKVHYV